VDSCLYPEDRIYSDTATYSVRCICSSDLRNTHTIFERKPYGNRPLVRHRWRWKNNVKTHVNETNSGVVNLIELSQNSEVGFYVSGIELSRCVCMWERERVSGRAVGCLYICPALIHFNQVNQFNGSRYECHVTTKFQQVLSWQCVYVCVCVCVCILCWRRYLHVLVVTDVVVIIIIIIIITVITVTSDHGTNTWSKIRY
jgi:hypothetical protein